MKNVHILCLLIIALTITSCGDKFIELDPISTVNVDNLYKTDKDFQDAVLGCYAVFREQYKSFWELTDLRSDDSWHQLGNDSRRISYDVFTLDPNVSSLRNNWLNYYKVINLANMVLTKIEGADEALVGNKARHIGEVRFLRALAYFDLVRLFGDVPMPIKPLTIEEAYQSGRTSTSTIYNEVIIPDLMAAESNLPSRYSGADVGRATSGAAKALLGKVHLTIKDFPKAEAKLQEVTTMGYDLLANYNDLFDYSKDEHHSEYIFDIEYEQGLGDLGSTFTNNFLPKSVGGTAEAYFGVIGGAEEMNQPTQDLIDAFEPGDLRKDVTGIGGGGFYDETGFFHKWVAMNTFTKKYVTNITTHHDSPVNWKVIRYADVLLMYAEALNENGKTAEALTYLNQIRRRAGVAEYDNLDQETAREKIWLERRLELAMEGHRWFDLLRTERAFSVMEKYGMKEYMTVFPIPLGEIRVINNESVLYQNPGYN